MAPFYARSDRHGPHGGAMSGARSSAFTDEPLDQEDERAAEHFNTCRAAGVHGSNRDFLLCAVAERRGFPVLTTDADFDRYAAPLPLKRHAIAPGRD